MKSDISIRIDEIWHIDPIDPYSQVSSIRKDMPGFIYVEGYAMFHLYGKICQISSLPIDVSGFFFYTDRYVSFFYTDRYVRFHLYGLICQLSSIRKAMPGYIYTKGYVRFHLYGRICPKLTYRSDRKNLIYRSAKKKNWHIHPYRWNLTYRSI
jgi:hypothetical protein